MKNRIFISFILIFIVLTFLCMFVLFFYTNIIFNDENKYSNGNGNLKFEKYEKNITTTTTITITIVATSATSITTTTTISAITSEYHKNNSRKVITSGENTYKNIPFNKINKKSKIAIVIDDLGIEYPQTKNFLESNIKLTYAIIPDAPIADEVYDYCIDNNIPIIIHIPMEPRLKKVEDNGIFVKMRDDEINNRLDYFFGKYEDVIGANNHMGSRATQDKRVMNLVLSNIKNKNLIWLDSVTSSNIMTKRIAKNLKVKYLERDVFLDNEKDTQYIKKQMEYLISIARKRGFAIGIGHVVSENLLLVLREYYKKEIELEIEFIFLDELVR